ncbi:MAG TPA: hypothetical protein DHW63_08025 [Hyphomonadaceae bacterium]|nr:hypothetical protein [Hyphomonadaceae bacterium]
MEAEGSFMRLTVFAALAALALAACGQAEAPKEEAPAAPQSMMEQILAQAPEMQPVVAYQQLVAYLTAHPEMQAACTGPRSTESRGIVPDDVAPDSIYAAHKGALVLSVQCGQQLTTVRDNPSEHWLVVAAPEAAEAMFINCADAQGRDQCPHAIPRAAPAP